MKYFGFEGGAIRGDVLPLYGLFIISVFKLLYTTIEKGHLMFDEDKFPSRKLYNLTCEKFNEDEYQSGFEAWLSREKAWEKHGPLIIPTDEGEILGQTSSGLWELIKEMEYTISVANALELGSFKLNPEHPLVKDIKYFKEVIETKITIDMKIIKKKMKQKKCIDCGSEYSTAHPRRCPNCLCDIEFTV